MLVTQALSSREQKKQAETVKKRTLGYKDILVLKQADTFFLFLLVTLRIV